MFIGKIDGNKGTLSVLVNPERYYSNATQIFKEEILDAVTSSLKAEQKLILSILNWERSGKIK